MKPEVSIPVGLATAAVVYGTYQWVAGPNLADVRTVGPDSTGESMLASQERTALFVAAGVSGAISLIAKDPVPFWLGAGLAVVLSWVHRYSRNVDPTTNKLPARGNRLAGARYTAEAIG